MSDKIYCHSNPDVLINKLNIHDTDRLLKVERRLTTLRLMDLPEKPISDKFDLEHSRNTHRYIFRNIYPWAEKIRTVDTAKLNMFYKAQFIEIQVKEIFGKLQKDDYLKQLSKEKFTKRAAYYLSGVNAPHPSREENGRTQRELIRQLACESGYVLHFTTITETKVTEAGIDSFVCNYEKVEALFIKVVEVR